ncbi:MAG: type II secretion system protein [Tepidisphaeraceae bacterium]
MNHRQDKAFTLIELLVTIGIITVLIGILIPVAASMRKTAKITMTQQTIAAIEAAVGMYQSDQRDWPGPFVEAGARHGAATEFAIGTAKLTVPNGTYTRPTRSEELFLCLAGGLTVTWPTTPPLTNPTGFTYNAEDIGRGHMNLGPRVRGRLKDYYSSARARSGINEVPGKITDDSDIPEYVDSFGGPILYVRALKGEASVDAYSVYLDDEVQFYQTAPTYPANSAPNKFFPSNYLASDNLPNQTRQQDRFVLISAGPDRKFGTADDVTNFGTPKTN